MPHKQYYGSPMPQDRIKTLKLPVFNGCDGNQPILQSPKQDLNGTFGYTCRGCGLLVYDVDQKRAASRWNEGH